MNKSRKQFSTSPVQRVKTRSSAVINVYLVLRQMDYVLCSLRHNTGYCDGWYGLISGHVEEEESATCAIIREAKEEADIEILPAQIKPVHIMHRKTDRYNIDIFFECYSWSGTLKNQEPHKCASLDFLASNKLPSNIIPYIQKTIKAILYKEAYSEEGWS